MGLGEVAHRLSCAIKIRVWIDRLEIADGSAANR